MQVITEILKQPQVWGPLVTVLAGATGWGLKVWWDSRQLKQAHRQRLVVLMTEKLHDYAEKYYMPLVGIARDLEMHLNHDDAQLSFYYLVRYISQYRKINTMMPGTFLTNLVAEKVVDTLEIEIYQCLTSPHLLSPCEYSIVESVNPDVTLATLVERLQDGDLASIY